MLQVLRSEYKLFLIIKKKGQNWELEPVLAVESLSLEDTSGIYKLSLLKLEMRGNTKSALVYLVGNFRIHERQFPSGEIKFTYIFNSY